MWFPTRFSTRGILLRCVAACYAIAFSSLYIQIPGLYGSQGLSPVHSGNDGRSESFLRKPTLVWMIRDALKLSHEHTLDVMCILGTVLSIGAVFARGFACGKLVFLINWLLYLSLYHVGGAFLWFQWDILLLELGFLCILLAPLSEDGKSRPWDGLNLEMVRWLLFRMMFTNGLVKLTSECPSWWSLEAMPLHYESQCIPTPVSWFAFNYLPTSFHQFSVAMTFMIEIPLTFLFYAPTAGLRKFAYAQQIVLMIVIMMTGNYNFFNLLFMTLCISLSDDSWWTKGPPGKRNVFVRFLLACFNLGVIAVLFYIFALNFLSKDLKLEIQFNMLNLNQFIAEVTPIGMAIGLAYFVLSLIEMILLILYSVKDGLFVFMKNVLWGAFHALLASLIFAKSMPVFVNGLEGAQMPKALTPPWDLKLLNDFDSFHIANSYGLFRRMTGVGGRPEVIILGSNDKNKWEEFQFLYKPGNLSSMPRYVLPHQPRLDWQMWFIALQGKFHLDKWFVNLCLRLIQGKRDVYNLMDRRSNTFNARSPPKYVKAHLYHYHFTSPKVSDSPSAGVKQWWFRELIDPEFINVVDEPTLQYYLEKVDVVSSSSEVTNNIWIYNGLRWMRKRTNEFEPHIVIWTISMLFLPVFVKISVGWML